MRRLFIMRKDLNMSPGKLSAQVSHCAEAYWTNKMRNSVIPIEDPLSKIDNRKITGYHFSFSVSVEEYENYINGSFVKTICQAKNKNHLMKAVQMAKELGLVEGEDFGLIRDNCLTELEPEDEDGRTTTGIWFKPLPDDISKSISKKYHLYM